MDRFDHYFEMRPLLGGIEPRFFTLQTITAILPLLATVTFVCNVTDPGLIKSVYELLPGVAPNLMVCIYTLL